MTVSSIDLLQRFVRLKDIFKTFYSFLLLLFSDSEEVFFDVLGDGFGPDENDPNDDD